MLSIIIPAHNEETVIARCLSAILTGAQPGELEVVVACNGCTDRTAEIARSFGPPVQVIEIPTASKTAALNAAEELATAFPRFYVDADVVLDLPSIRNMAEVLSRGDVHFATPSLQLDLSRSSWLVRAYYRVWTQLPYNCNHGQVGTGVYALSAAGRARFGRFPYVINDDGYVRLQFHDEERATINMAHSLVRTPRTVAALIRAKSRVRVGRVQLRQMFPRHSPAVPQSRSAIWRWLAHHPQLWFLTPLYGLITLVTHVRAGRVPRSTTEWSRDDSRDATGAA